MGLPDPALRLVAENPPSAHVQWLTYREAFLVLLPAAQVAAIVDARLELHVGDPAAPVAGLHDGHLRVVWADYSGGPAKSAKYARYALGTGVLLVLLGCAISMARRDASAPARPVTGADDVVSNV